MAVKEHLAVIRKALDQAEREFEEIARLAGNNGFSVSTEETPRVVRKARSPKANSAIGLPDAVKQILPGAGPMHVKDFFEKATALGYVTNADNPVDSIDIQLYKLSKNLPISKVGKRTWKWND